MHRPLSPHLFIYKPQIGSIFSIFHRISGASLSVGILFFWAFLCISFIPCSFGASFTIYSLCCFVLQNIWVLIAILASLLFCWTFHFFNGIRHIIWDFFSSKTLNKEWIKSSSYVILIFMCFSLFSILCFFL